MLYTLVRYLGKYSEVGNILYLGELIALGGAVFEHGQSEHPEQPTTESQNPRYFYRCLADAIVIVMICRCTTGIIVVGSC